jgi:biopolymer transport protein ExbD
MAQESRKMRQEVMDEEPGFMMTPMVDIVFQLLIFFMLACRFRTTDGQLDAFLPKNRGIREAGKSVIILGDVRVKLLWVIPGTTRETSDPTRGETLLKIKNIAFRNVVNRYGEVIPDYDGLYKYICRARDNFLPSKSYKTLPVIIDARRQVPFKHVMYAMNECIRAGLKDITFAAPEIPY